MPQPRRPVPRALPPDERARVLSMLNDDRFADLPPAEVYATLLDEGKFVCSISTMYRILRENHQVRERRDQLRHPFSPAPELLATRPNELWSWDITKLKGPAKWVYFYLYVILDVFSRYAVGWMVAYQASRDDFEELVSRADLVVTHAGAGSIGRCLIAGKKPVVVPRRKVFGEHVNDHQLELVRELEGQGRIYAVYDTADLHDVIRAALNAGTTQPKGAGDSNIVAIVRNFLDQLTDARSTRT